MNKQQLMKLQKLQRDFLFNNKVSIHIDCRSNSFEVWVFSSDNLECNIWFEKNDTDETFNTKYSNLFNKIKELYK